MDSTVKDIWFDSNNECKYCRIHDLMELKHPINENGKADLDSLISKIKRSGTGKKYDCIAGVSGGRDSTFTLYTSKSLGLRPLAVHFDNGWNSEISVRNIKNACEKLNIDLYTVVADWEEFKDLQIAFLKSSTPDADIPTDYAIYSVLYDIAYKENVKFILNGHSFRTEGTSPISWTYMDPLYVRAVHRKFGRIRKFRSFPHMTISKLLYYIFIRGIREIRLMEYIDYKKAEADIILKNELDWQYYGGHHHENLYTRFFQSYYLPKKFNIDKRKTELSALIRSGQITRKEALNELETAEYVYDEEVVRYAINKLGISKDDWESIISSPVKSHDDYPTLLPFIRLLKLPVRVAVKFKALPSIFYLKYAK
jgi:N-acetyl sugar amidotransferase